MRIKKYKKHQPLAVFWLDTVEDSAWHVAEDTAPYVAVPCTLGFYAGHDKNLLYMRNTMLPEGDGSKIEIPVGMIRCVCEMALIMNGKKLHQQLVDEVKDERVE